MRKDRLAASPDLSRRNGRLCGLPILKHKGLPRMSDKLNEWTVFPVGSTHRSGIVRTPLLAPGPLRQPG